MSKLTSLLAGETTRPMFVDSDFGWLRRENPLCNREPQFFKGYESKFDKLTLVGGMLYDIFLFESWTLGPKP